MELKEAAYKTTELECIPKDWTFVPISDVAFVVGGGTPSTSVSEYWNGEIQWFTPTEIGNRKYSDKSIRTITQKGLESSSAQILPVGSVLMTTRASIGDLSILVKEAATNQGFQSLVPKVNADSEYLYYAIAIRKADLLRNASGSTFLEISPKKVKALKIPLPPTLEEQKAIATALSDVDTLITHLDKLIAKKKAIKQGAMQRLLKSPAQGGQRLPGFEGEWVEKSLGENSILKARIGWQGLTTEEYLNQGDYFLITGTDFNSGFINWNSCHFVEKDRYDQDLYIQSQVGDILITKDGTIGKVAFIDHLPKPATLNSGVFVVRPKKQSYHPEFLYHIFMSSFFKEFLSQLSAGSTINHLYQKDLVHFKFFLPPSKEEQKAIAIILSDMDKEIESLEIKKSKHLHIKQGMMQELLTGKTRLI